MDVPDDDIQDLKSFSAYGHGGFANRLCSGASRMICFSEMTTADRERARSLLNKLSQPFDHSRAQIEDAAHVLGSDKGRLYMVMPGQPIHPACLALEALARKYR